jgi:YHS domain-containing protein
LIRKILFFLAFVGVWSLVRLLLRQLPTAAPARGRSHGGPPALDGSLVRDRVCQTFVPRSRALVVRDDDGEHFFCSDACRSAFEDKRRATP